MQGVTQEGQRPFAVTKFRCFTCEEHHICPLAYRGRSPSGRWREWGVPVSAVLQNTSLRERALSELPERGGRGLVGGNPGRKRKEPFTCWTVTGGSAGARAGWKGRRRNATSRQSKYHHMCALCKNRNVNRALSKINTCKINTEGQYIKQK